MRAVAQLAELNELDLAVDATRARLADITDALKEPVALRSARSALVLAEAELARCQSRLRDCDQAQKGAADKLARSQQKLYGGKVTNSKELENLQADQAQLKRQQEHADDDLLEAMIAAEAAAAEVASGRDTVARLSSEHEAARKALLDEQARLIKRLAVELARQTGARVAASAALLPTYDALRARKSGRAVALLEGEACGACRVAVSPTLVEAARYGDEPVFCENCGRLLWGE
jgi:uncharacterized protein